jgi:hypothetical protein
MRARLQKMIDKIASAVEKQPQLRRAALARAAALAGGALPQLDALLAMLTAYVERVARHAWKISDEDVAELRADGLDEDAIYEVTVAAAVGAGVARYQVAMRALEAAKQVSSTATATTTTVTAAAVTATGSG